MIVNHSGQQIDAAKNPIEATILCLNASAGCSSKARAWAWADDAVKAAAFFSESLSSDIKKALYESETNFPNVEMAFSFLEHYL